MRILIIEGNSGKKIKLRLPTSILLSNMSASIISRTITKHLNSGDSWQTTFNIGGQKGIEAAEFTETLSTALAPNDVSINEKDYISFTDALAEQQQKTEESDHIDSEDNNNNLTKLEFIDGETYYRSENSEALSSDDTDKTVQDIDQVSTELALKDNTTIEVTPLNNLSLAAEKKTLKSKRKVNSATLKRLFRILKNVKKAHNGKFTLVEIISGDGDVVIIEL